MEKDKLKYWLAISRLPHLGPVRFKKLYHHFPDLKKAWQADAGDLKKIGLDSNTAELITAAKENINPDQLLEELNTHGLNALCLTDKNYPHLLKEIYDPPPVLYCRGRWQENNVLLAVVGTRKISSYGRRIVQELVPQIVRQQLTTVSGLALGIDALVHEETVKAGGQTVAVLGSGLDEQNIYPSSNRYLAHRIIDSGGCLLSEYPPGTLPLKQHFPRRNRLISGLARGVVIIEGSKESGSLITAACALEQNREIMAVPGSIYAANSAGPNLLIKQGAKLIANFQDIMDCLEINNLRSETAVALPQLNSEEKIIYDLLSLEPTEIDELIRQSGLLPAKIYSTISLLEMKGLIKNIGNNTFIKNKR